MINIPPIQWFTHGTTRSIFGFIFSLTLVLASIPAVAALNTAIAPHAAIEQHRKASVQMQIGNYAIAFCIWQPMAEQNDGIAQYNIGWMYHNGYGLAINDEMAFFWWIKAAAGGNIDAEYALGDLYLQGLGVDRDLSIALGWYLSATQKGHQSARETLLALLQNDDAISHQVFTTLLKSDWSLFSNAMQVDVDRANVRSGPGKQYPVVATLQRGHIVIPLRQQNGWTRIGITGLAKTAWIFSRLIGNLSEARQ